MEKKTNILIPKQFLNLFVLTPDLWLPNVFILGHPVLVLHLLQTPELQPAVKPAREHLYINESNDHAHGMQP